MCSRQNIQNERESYMINFPDFQDILRQFPRLRQLTFAGYGEPFTNPDLLSMVKYGKEKRLYIRVITNGKLLPRIDPQAIIKSGLDRMDISIHAMNPETFRMIRGEERSNIDEVKKSVRALARMRERNGHIPHIVINNVAMKMNLDEIPDVIDWAISIGADEVSIAKMTLFGTETENISLNKAETKKLIRYKKEGVRKGIKILFCDKGDHCLDLWNHMIIKSDGDVVPCVGLDCDWSIGNIRTTQVQDMWSGPQYQALRARFLAGALTQCSGCAQGGTIEGPVSRFAQKVSNKLTFLMSKREGRY